jgi:mycothiol synthase
MSPTLTIEPARPDEREEAFRLIFRQPPASRDDRVANAMRLVRQGDLDPAGLLVAREGTGLRGAIICLPVPGAGGLVWPPQASAEPVEDALVRRAAAWLRQNGARLGQCLLAPGETALAAPLERNGFRHVTTLWYMQHDLQLPYDLVRGADRLTFRSYADGSRDLFHQTLLRTYEATLDCPEVSGVRALEEVVEGHQAQGAFDPGRWWLALDGNGPVGVLLLMGLPDLDAWEVAYVGVVPEARRHGWGRELMHKALRAAHAADPAHLTLSVDARNRPAWQLYLDLGFEAYDCREVFLAVWDPAR